MNQDQDYDNDGNNIVPCPICLDVYCPSKEGGKCPEEDEYAASFDTMQKDYQEVERIVDSIDDILFKYDLEYMSSPAREEIVAVLTTFSNARELEGVEKTKIEKIEVLNGGAKIIIDKKRLLHGVHKRRNPDLYEYVIS